MRGRGRSQSRSRGRGRGARGRSRGPGRGRGRGPGPRRGRGRARSGDGRPSSDRDRSPVVEVVPDNVVYGMQPVREALKKGARIETLMVAHGVGAPKRELVRAAKKAGAKIMEVPRSALDRKAQSEQHQGIVALLSPEGAPDYVEAEAILDAAESAGESPLVVLLDGVQDPRNLGALIRTAHGLGAHGVVISENRSAPITAVTVKTAAGATQHIPIARVKNIKGPIEMFQSRGLMVVATAADGESLISTGLPLGGPVAVVVGSEGKGVRPTVRALCDGVVAIPLSHGFDSLNVSVAAGVVLYELRRRRELA